MPSGDPVRFRRPAPGYRQADSGTAPVRQARDVPDRADRPLRPLGEHPLALQRHEQAARAHFMLAEVFEELGNLESSQRERTLGRAHLEKSIGDR